MHGWIPIRTNLHDDPDVFVITSALNVTADTAVGLLVKFWSWADLHTATGRIDGVTLDWIDHYIGANNFGKTLLRVGWLRVTDNGITIPNWRRWHSKSAKKRLQNAVRQRRYRARSSNGPVTPKPSPSALHREQNRILYNTNNKHAVEDSLIAAGVSKQQAHALAQRPDQVRVALRNAEHLEQTKKLKRSKAAYVVAAVQGNFELLPALAKLDRAAKSKAKRAAREAGAAVTREQEQAKAKTQQAEIETIKTTLRALPPERVETLAQQAKGQLSGVQLRTLTKDPLKHRSWRNAMWKLYQKEARKPQ